MATYYELCRNWTSWCEFVNPSGAQSKQEWDAMPIEDRFDFVVRCFGLERRCCEHCGQQYDVDSSRDPDSVPSLCPECSISRERS